jgi:hypothetical protein
LKKKIICIVFILICSCNETPKQNSEEKLPNISDLKQVLSNEKVNQNKPLPIIETIEESHKQLVKLPEIVTKVVLASSIMSRDSGKAVTAEFLRGCVEEHTKTYFKFYCKDLLWEHHLSIINNSLIYFLEDGVSVENRDLFSIMNGEVKK